MSRPPSVTAQISRLGALGAIATIASAVLAAGYAQAQSASGTLSAFRTGYGAAGLTGLESPVSPSLISSGSQFAISDGVNSAGSAGSLFTTEMASGQTSTSPSSGGAGQSYTGAAQAAMSNERTPLTVTDSAAANAAGLRAATTGGPPQSDMVLNGKLNLDGGQ